MPDKFKHALVGGFIGLMCYLGYSNSRNSKPSLLGAVTSSALGGLAGVFADLVEPASDPNHRGALHSTIAGSLLIYSLEKIARSDTISQENKLLSAILGLGYLSHLALDSNTRKGLPII